MYVPSGDPRLAYCNCLELGQQQIRDYLYGNQLTDCSIFHFGQIYKFKMGITPRKKIESKFLVNMHIYTLFSS